MWFQPNWLYYTYLYEKRGPQYHWVIVLFRLLKLLMFDGVHAALEEFKEKRMAELNCKKTDRFKRKQIVEDIGFAAP